MSAPIYTAYRGLLLNTTQLAMVSGVHRNTLQRWRSQQNLCEEWIDAYKLEREMLAKARRSGVGESTARMRLMRGWDVERAYTTPPMRRKAG